MKYNLTRKQQRKLIAHHEAAHAVVTRKLGLNCPAICMFATDKSGQAVAFSQSAAHYADKSSIEARIEGLKRDVMVHLAGPIANVAYSGKTKQFDIGTESDIEAARNATYVIALLRAGREVPGPGECETITLDVPTLDAAPLSLI